MRTTQRVFPLGLLLSPLILASLTSVASARVKTPRMEELVESADLIVVAKAESVRATPREVCRLVGTTILLIAAAGTSVFCLWRKKLAIVAFIVVVCFLVISLLDVPHGTYRKVAYLSVSSTIKGTPPQSQIPVYYDDGFVCDVTRFTAGQEYLLFLRGVSPGYTVSWYDWSQWTIEDAYAQTERRTWNKVAPIALPELITRIRALCEKERQDGARHTLTDRLSGTEGDDQHAMVAERSRRWGSSVRVARP